MRFFVCLIAILFTSQVFSQQPKAEAKKKAPTPAFVPTVDVAGLPRVLIIGDSISIGYQVALKEALAGKANVHRPAVNCGPSSRGVEQIEDWLGNGKWDVIHFNFGLHDVRHFDYAKKPVDADQGHRQVNDADYEKNLETLVTRMKKTGAKLVFGLTTPVPEGAAGRIKGDEVKYNEIASRVMQRQAVAIDDLYGFALPKLAEIQRPKDVHYTEEGSKVLAGQVAASILKELHSK
jgi:lysophospholipase L1-like esterase